MCSMNDAENSYRSARRVVGKPFAPGRSGNPGGRPRAVLDVQQLARERTAEAIAALVAALSSPKERVPAAIALLNRGWGLPKVTVEADATSPMLLHLAAAQLISAELLAEREQRDRVIDGCAKPKLGDLSMAPLPLE